MFIFLVVVNAYSPVTGIGCLLCLVFLFFETAFGICLGCKVYSLLYKDKAQHCPGEVCDAKSKQDIQKTSGVQLLIIFGFIAYISLRLFYLMIILVKNHMPCLEPGVLYNPNKNIGKV